MGIYLNPDNQVFKIIVNIGKYVDKTGLICYTNEVCVSLKLYIASVRPRRFGKSIAANMLSAYYSI